MTRFLMLIAVVAGCGKTDTSELERRVKALEEKAVARAVAPDAGVVHPAPAAAASGWWCVTGAAQGRESKCFENPRWCATLAANNFANCENFLVAYCVSSDRKADCYRDFAACFEAKGSACEGRTVM